MLKPFFQLDKLLTLSSLFTSLSIALPLQALAIPVAVLRSPENANQWPEITNRLRSAGVNYCILDSNSWRGDSDLNKISVLLLPNVENINGIQATTLSRWMNHGGKVIVTGPTGNLSEPAIRNQLRSLFGAYWGFANSRPFTLRPTNLGDFRNQKPLATSLIGGVIIPTGVNSQTAAVWGSQGNPPAVIVTDNSIFLGWRWGADAVASNTLDSAWLEVALKRYGIARLGTEMSVAPLCQNRFTATAPVRSVVNPPPVPVATNPVPSRSTVVNNPPVPVSNRSTASNLPPPAPESTVTPPLETVTVERAIRERGSLTPQDVTEMSEELARLIGRYETTLLASEARNGGILGTDKAVEQAHRDQPKDPSAVATQFRQTLTRVRETLTGFQQLTAQGSYAQAREFWLQARRSLWDNYPTERQIAQPEIRAMWLDRGTIVGARSEEDLAKVFDRMAEAGINVVFFETVNASYTIYPSQVAPEQNPLTRGWDPLKAAVKLAHERNMEIHAWVWVFAAANQAHNKVLDQPLDYLGPVLSRNPDWRATNKDGGVFDYGRGYKKAFFDPANPEVQNYLLALYTEIVTNYDVDGVQLDYIRYPFQSPKSNETFGYGKSSRILFQQMTGVDPISLNPQSALWEQWTGFRIRQIDGFVSLVSTRLKQIRPDLILSVAVFPLPRLERLHRLQQNWEEWGQNQWVDLVFLMTYALDTGSLEDKTQALFDRSVAGSSLVIPGIRLLKVPDPVTIDQIQFIRNLPTPGFALFATENLNPNLQTILNRVQGSVTSKRGEPLPYRKPFKAAAARFGALRQEWSFLLVNNLLLMDEVTLKTWGQQVDTVATQLDRLAETPTRGNLASAQRALQSFQGQFDTWTARNSQKIQPYQAQVWKNRLETLQRLLSYGQQREFDRARNEVGGN